MTFPLQTLPDYASFPSTLLGQGHSIQALYLHVPFCSTKCHYCDFYSIAGHLNQTEDFLRALQSEIDLYRNLLGPIAPQTIFIGGGTPTLLAPNHLDQLLRLIQNLMPNHRPQEFTVEANPNTFDPDRAKVLAAHGVNRLSFGAQSFIPAELQTLQRDHDPENVPKAFQIARQANIQNLNLDLIFGIPGQTLDSWNFSLQSALALNPDHMSCYSLTYEPNTAMTARMKKGDFTPIDEDLELTLFNHVYTTMREAGFTRYEVSNYARGAGKECQHNLHYWKASNWLALGPAAAAHLNGHRWKNIPSLNHYVASLAPRSEQSLASSRHLPLTQYEHLPPRAWAAETALFWLRLTEGLNYHEFQQRTQVDARPLLEKALKKYADLAYVHLTPTHAKLTEIAIPVSNKILAEILPAFD
jgi:oxygen-independent coproporphyrinogen-3 oxidase